MSVPFPSLSVPFPSLRIAGLVVVRSGEALLSFIMHTKGDDERSRLFRRYSANLALYLPEWAGRFACPICLMGFDECAVLHENLLVDIGHVFPKELE